MIDDIDDVNVNDDDDDVDTNKDSTTFQNGDKSFHQVSKSDTATNCPSEPPGYETTYPVFSGQTEYGQQGVHLEPFYRYRVYSESKV